MRDKEGNQEKGQREEVGSQEMVRYWKMGVKRDREGEGRKGMGWGEGKEEG